MIDAVKEDGFTKVFAFDEGVERFESGPFPFTLEAIDPPMKKF